MADAEAAPLFFQRAKSIAETALSDPIAALDDAQGVGYSICITEDGEYMLTSDE